MKRLVSLIIISSLLLTSCAGNYDHKGETVDASTSVEIIETSTIETLETSIENTDSINPSEAEEFIEEESINIDQTVNFDDFDSLSDPDLHEYIVDEIYAELESELASDDFEVVNVNAIYISQEYIDELEYNSQKNIYFGYTIDEIVEQYGDTPYIFTLGEDGTTVVQPIENSEDHYNEIVRNVAVGSGIILICVTVAVLTGPAVAGPSAGAGIKLLNVFFSTAARRAIEYGAAGSVVSGVVNGIVTGYQTGDYQEAFSNAVYEASNGFKWGAIVGSITGGFEGLGNTPNWIRRMDGHPNWMESESDIALELGAEEQISYLAGEEVDMFTLGATRPDAVIQNADGTITAVEIKNYDLINQLSNLRSELRRQIGQRVTDLPEDSLQEIYLDVRGRGYSNSYLYGTVKPYLNNALSDIYPNIPIRFYGG